MVAWFCFCKGIIDVNELLEEFCMYLLFVCILIKTLALVQWMEESEWKSEEFCRIFQATAIWLLSCLIKNVHGKIFESVCVFMWVGNGLIMWMILKNIPRIKSVDSVKE